MSFKETMIYDSLLDLESKRIFKARHDLMVSNDGDEFFNAISQDDKPWNILGFNNWLSDLEKMDMIKPEERKIYIFGAGQYGKMTFITLKKAGFSPVAFIDNDETRYSETFMSLPVYSLSSVIEQDKDFCVLIAVKAYYEPIYEKLCQKIKRPYIWLDLLYKRAIATIGKQYFDFFEKPGENIGIFIDCGCYDLGNALDFIDWCDRKYDKIIAFEPDRRNYENCMKEFSQNKIEKFTLVNKGIWNEDSVLHFAESNFSMASAIHAKGGTRIEVTSIDNIVKNMEKPVEVGFIKMDIEGAELNGLVGAKETIIQFKPKLAISVYHKADDFISIPLYIKELRDDYKFAYRHYTNTEHETILYAW